MATADTTTVHSPHRDARWPGYTAAMASDGLIEVTHTPTGETRLVSTSSAMLQGPPPAGFDHHLGIHAATASRLVAKRYFEARARRRANPAWISRHPA